MILPEAKIILYKGKTLKDNKHLIVLQVKVGTNDYRRISLSIAAKPKEWNATDARFRDTKAPIRRLIYTTNPIEGYHRQVRKVTKTKGAFTSEQALMKLIYLTTQRIMDKWTSPLQNWSITIQQLAIHFEGRIDL